jgi:hypothetical protein
MADIGLNIGDLMAVLQKISTTDAAPGLIVAGNIDYRKQPKVKNPDGSISTVRSMSFERNGKEILVPTVHPDGYIMTPKQAISHYDKTGRHMGIFSNPQTATGYASTIHDNYARGLYD